MRYNWHMETKSSDIFIQNKVFAYLALATGAILLLPLVAMQFTAEVRWTLFDFVVMGLLLYGVGFLFVHIARITPRKYRVLIGLAFLAALLYFWAELAVGVFTTLGS